MKKIFQYSLAALVGLALTGCKGDYDDWASPQNNPAEDAAAKYGVTIVAGEDANVVMPVRNDDIKLVALTASSDKVADYAVTKLTVNGEEIEGSIDKGNIIVSAEALNSIIQNQFNSRASVKRSIEVVSEVSLILNNGDAVTSDVVGTTAASITPKATPAIDAKGYYILGGFEGNGWSLATPIWMEKESDGVYSAVVTLSSDGDNWYKFYEGSHYSDSDWDEVNQGQMGCAVNGDSSLENFVVYTGDDQDVQTPVINGDAGNMYKVTLDMNNLTYKVVRQAVNYYIVGGPNDWAASCASKELTFSQANIDDPVYTITFAAVADGDTWFAIGDDKACDAIVSEGDEAAWKLLFGTTSGNGNSGTSGTLARRTDLTDEGSFKVDAGAKYIKVTINMKDMSYEVATLNFEPYLWEAGVNNDWGSVERPLYCPDGNGTYTGYFYAQAADWSDGKGAFKFRGASNNWDNGNYGTGTINDDGLSGTLINDGGSGNILVDPGFYRANVNLADMTYRLTKIEHVSIIGTANGNWDTDTDLTYNVSEGCWEVTTDLNAGEMKFRGNHNWDGDVDLGGSFDSLIPGGSNIAVEAGNYTIKLYILCENRHYAVVTKN